MRLSRTQKTGYRKSATVLLLTVAFLFCRGGRIPVTARTAPDADPAALLLEGLTHRRESIDLRSASLPVSELGSLYQELLLDTPELFHVAPRLSYGYTEADGLRTVTEVRPVYTMTEEALTAARLLYRDTVTSILSEMQASFGSHAHTEADIVLYLHDLLADRYDYDPRPEGSPHGAPNADAYTFLRDGIGICQAYALVFLALARGAGLEAHTVVSPSMDHAWNHVRVEGVWYHVDVTRDDPIPAEGGSPAVTHTRLLRSDEGMNSLGYHGYSCSAGHSCTDTRFETIDGGGALGAFSQKLRFWGGAWVGMDKSGDVVAVKLEKHGVFSGQVGDVDLNGEVDPADLLAVYDPSLPDEWREGVRGRLVR